MLIGSHYQPYSRRKTDYLMTSYGILTVHTLYALRVACTIHKHLQTCPSAHLPSTIHNYTPVHQLHQHNTRRANSQRHTLYHTNDMGPLQSQYLEIWNNDKITPPHIREITDSKTFKNTLKRHLLHYQLYTLSLQSTV